MFRRILIAIDESEPSKRALAEVLKLVRAGPPDSYEIRLLYVVDDALDQSALVDIGAAALAEGAQHAAEAGATSATEMVSCRGRTIAAVILEEAAAFSADLISLGTHARKGLLRAMIGSVAEEVIRESRVPVLLPGK